DGVFRVKEVRNCIDDIFLPSQVIDTRWVMFVPIKVSIFIWRVRQDYLPTRVNLVRRGINVDSCVCPICSTGEDEINHILFRCDLAQQHDGIYGGLGTASFFREFFPDVPRGGIEQEQFDALADQIRDAILAPTPDRWVWSLEKSGVFSVASIRKMIDDKRLPEVATKTRWIKVVPIKVNVHAWKTSSHLFFSCNLARTLTRRIIQCWDISDEEFNAYKEWLSWIVNIRLPSKKKMMLEDKACQSAIAELAMQFDAACTTKDDLRKAFKKCDDISQESRALIDTFLKEEYDRKFEFEKKTPMEIILIA
nr:RNA-directed DNA polymerase, eukaryota [Tanacetum cinerariifolium]